LNSFIYENNIEQINKNPTEIYQKQIQQALQKCSTLIEKERHKYLINKKPAVPKLNAYIKAHKQGALVRPVINCIQTLSYKVAEHFNKKLQILLNLPNNCITKIKVK
jgi:thermostable 8-oxoguanine DNA glycosylase